MIQVYELMTTNVVTLNACETVEVACEVMSRGDFRHLPILNENKKIVGVLSHRDILRCGVSHLIANHAERQAMLDKKVRVKEIMTSPVRIIHPRDSLRSCGLLMQKYKYGCLPVVDKDRLVGIVTDTDFLRMAIHLIETQEAIEEFEPLEIDDYLPIDGESSLAWLDNMH